MPDEDEDEVNDRDDEPADPPGLPIVVKLAGIVWIGFGALEWIAVVISLAQAGANGQAGAQSSPLVTCCPGLIGLAFLVCGYQTVTGKAKDTLGNGIGSILLGLLQLAAGIILGVIGVAANNQNNDGVGVAIIAAFLGVLGTGLITAGGLALFGRSDYREWRRSQRQTRRRRPRDDDDD